MSNPLASVLREQSKYTYGDNGALEFKTSGSSILDSFVNLLQDTEVGKIKESVKKMVSELEYLGSDESRRQHIHDIFILLFHKRSTSKKINDITISDGEGLKNVFYEYLIELYNFYPKTIVDIIKDGTMFMYGYWKDALLIWTKINKLDMTPKYKYQKYNTLIEALRYSMITQRVKDLDTIFNQFGFDTIKDMNEKEFKDFIKDKELKCSISYLGKYCVRENSSFDKSAYWVIKAPSDNSFVKVSHVDYMIRYTLRYNKNGVNVEFPTHKSVPFGAKKTWRKDNVKLNVILNVPENHFCSNNWSDINIKNIPSICLKRKTKALLNEQLKSTNDLPEYEYTGNRFPDNPDRVECRQNLIEFMSNSKTVNCSQLYPHQIVGDLQQKVSSHERMINQKIWDSLITYTKDRVTKYLEENAINDSVTKSVNSGNILCCADVSGSMCWVNKVPNRPIDIAVALTAFMSELANDNFKDIAMSFTDIPSIFDLKVNGKRMNMYDRINTIMSHVGYSTNFIGIHSVLIDLCINKHIKQEDIPTLVIFSDGNFDEQIKTSSVSRVSTHEHVLRMWLDAGYKSPPQIVYWNLAANKDSVQVDARFPNVQLLSGSGVSNIKYVLYGEQAEVKVQKVMINGVETEIETKDISPEQTMRKALDEEYFDPLRYIIAESNEGYLKYYN